MSFDKYLRACLSGSLLQEVQLLFALGTVLITAKLVALIRMCCKHTYGVIVFFCIGLKLYDEK